MSLHQSSSAGNAPVFRADRLEVTYGSSRGATQAIGDFSAVMEKGEFVSILGPSGCGKSTLLKIASGLLAPSAGVAELNGQLIKGPNKDVGIVFQQATLLPWLSVLDNVLLPIKTLGLDLKAGTERAKNLLELTGLSNFAKHHPHELSGGMQQRVGIARGLVHDPSLLLMDEPFAALDAMTREHMMVELQRIWSESRKSVIFITHSIQEAVFLSTRVLVLSHRPARVLKDIAIDLPMPRTEETMAAPRFGELCAELRAMFQPRK